VPPSTEVLLDAVQLSGRSSASGIGTYVRELLRGLAGVPDIAVSALATSDAELPPSIRRRRIQRIVRRGRPSIWEHEIRRSVDPRIRKADVFHNPNPHAPILPPRCWVQTLYDVIPLVSDDPALRVLKRQFRRYGPRYREADAVVAISRHAADEGMRLLGLDRDRLHVIYPGVGPEFTPSVDPPNADPPYITVVSEFSQRKGFAEAFSVIGSLAEAGYPHRLAVIGRVRSRARAEFDSILAASPRPDRIDIMGFVPDLVSVYRGATAHLMSSRYEGFGLPAVEAIACGTPVVSFDNTSLPEVVGEAGLLVPDGDVEAAVTALRSIIDSPGLRQELREKGLVQASKFDWKGVAEQHAEIYRDVANH
jgi:glycosyltransferase involved in cell wall biosynthesis